MATKTSAPGGSPCPDTPRVSCRASSRSCCLLVMVFFLSRLTGDPAALFLPIDATPEMIEQFRELHGLNDPLIVQFGRYVWDVLHLDFGDSLRQARPAIDVVLQAFVWTLWLARHHHDAGHGRGHRHRLARRLPPRRHLRPDRHLHLADRRLGPGLLDRHRRHHRLRHRPRLAADLRHRHRSGTGSCRSPCCSSGRSA